ncbi:protein TIC 22-like, chloroplastic [Aristolochia californica]|uniref:protein TIC 22-like, chloroplastic n=1 Tax=Aristolochia californica TaxID=171875 RepID=UPI0035D56FA6
MQFFSTNPEKPNGQNPLSTFQAHFSAFVDNLSKLHLPSLEPNIQLSIQNLQNHVNQAFQSALSHFSPTHQPLAPLRPSASAHSSRKNHAWASTSSAWRNYDRSTGPMSSKDIEERLAGVPVYALSNSSEEFVLVSGVRTGKSLGLLCFRREDAEALLQQMRIMDPGMRSGSKVVAVALNKVFQLKVDGVAFRFIPDASEIKNAIKEREKMGNSDQSFPGVPVFQSQSLILSSQNRRYRPVFFRKEDLERSLSRASSEHKALNPSYRQGDVQVRVLEEIIKDMKESSVSKWDDVVFIPPGFDISAGATSSVASARSMLQ